MAAVGVLLAFSGGALAQERASTSPGDKAQRTTFKTFGGVEGGYDSNLDNRVQAKGSYYEMISAGTSGSTTVSDDESYTMYLRGRYYRYDELDNSSRYDIDAAVGARYDLSAATGLKLGAAYYRDLISDDPADIFSAFSDLVHETEFSRTRIKLGSRTELNIDSEGQGALDKDVFDVSRGRAFDFTKNGITASYLAFRKETVAPFVIVNYTNIDYFHQVPNPAIDRNANEEWAVAGIRVTLGKTFHMDLGGRYNNRDFDDTIFTHFSSGFVDARFVWQATDTLTIRGSVERQIKEPTTSFGLADDVKTYELSFDKRLGLWTVYGRAWLDHVEPIGDTFVYNKYYWALGVRYDVNINTELYADYLGRYAQEETRDEHYDRNRVGAGVRMRY